MVKKCKCCGKLFTPRDRRSVCCSISCGGSYAAQKGRGIADEDIQPPSPKTQLARKETASFERRARLAKRDRDYAESGYAAPVTVEEREFANSELGTIMRIETRGQACLGWRSCSHVSHNG